MRFWGAKTASAWVHSLLGKQDMVGSQQLHRCLRKWARNVTVTLKCTACLWGFSEEDRPSQPHLWEDAGVPACQGWRTLWVNTGRREAQRVSSCVSFLCYCAPAAWEGEGSKPDGRVHGTPHAGRARRFSPVLQGRRWGKESEGFLLCNTGHHR